MIFPTEIEVSHHEKYLETRRAFLEWYVRYFCYLNHLTH